MSENQRQHDTSTETTPTGTEAFRRSRDHLISLREDVAAARRDFRWPEVGDDFTWAIDWFDAIAEGNSRRALWIVEEDGTETTVSFDEMRRRSTAVAIWLAGRGVRQGDHVMLMLGNQVELWEAMLAIMKLGAVILPTSVVLGAHDLHERVERADVRHIIANVGDASKFDDVPGDYGRIVVGGAVPGWQGWPANTTALAEEQAAAVPPAVLPKVGVSSADPALVYFTSGTTSKPKMVVHTQQSYPVGHLSTMYWLGLKPGDVHLAISSPGWAKHAWSCFFAPWIAEATVFVYNYQRFDADALVTQLDRAQVTTFCAPPTVWRMLIQHDLEVKPSALREALSAGEPLNPEVIARIREWWGLDIRDGYGQTEMTAVIANPPGQPIVAGSMGSPLPGIDIVIVDPVTGEVRGQESADADGAVEGELCLDLSANPVNLMAGYLGDEARMAEATRGGFFHTGDVASRSATGGITFIGRTDDIFKSSDFKVSPFEVESALIEHAAVAEAAVVGAPDDVRLNITKAYIALAAGWDDSEDTARAVLAHARTALPPYMRVRRVEFFALPKTSSGKIRRVELREREVGFAERGERVPGEWREEDFPGLKG